MLSICRLTELKSFLQFTSSTLEESEADFEDEYILQLQKTIRDIKESREMGVQYMLLEELLQDEREAGIMEGRMETQRNNIYLFLQTIGAAPQELLERIANVTDFEKLTTLLQAASKANTMDEFVFQANQILDTADI